MDEPRQLSADVYNSEEDDFVVIQSGESTPAIDQSLSALSQPDLIATCRKLMEGNTLLGDVMECFTEKLRNCTADLELMQQKYKNLVDENQMQCNKARQLVESLVKKNESQKAVPMRQSVSALNSSHSDDYASIVTLPTNGESMGSTSAWSMPSQSMCTDVGIEESGAHEDNIRTLASPRTSTLPSDPEAVKALEENEKLRSSNATLKDCNRELNERVEELEAKLKSTEQASLQEKQALKNQLAEAMSLNERHENEHKKAASRKETEAAELKEKLREKELDTFGLKGQIQRLETELVQQRRLGQENNKLVEELRKQVQQKTAQYDKIKGTATESAKHLQRARAERADLEAQMNAQKVELDRYRTHSQRVQADLQTAQQTVGRLRHENEALRQHNNRLNANNVEAAQAANRMMQQHPVSQPEALPSEGMDVHCPMCEVKGTEEYVNNHLQRDHGI